MAAQRECRANFPFHPQAMFPPGALRREIEFLRGDEHAPMARFSSRFVCGRAFVESKKENRHHETRLRLVLAAAPALSPGE